jgi:hypothetical protein
MIDPTYRGRVHTFRMRVRLAASQSQHLSPNFQCQTMIDRASQIIHQKRHATTVVLAAMGSFCFSHFLWLNEASGPFRWQRAAPI